MFDVPPHLRDQRRSHPTSNGVSIGLSNLLHLYTSMPVPVNDKRQEWLRKHAPRPESIKTLNASKLRVVMDTWNERFGQFYKIHAMVCSIQTITLSY
jgi:hypothetical protein